MEKEMKKGGKLLFSRKILRTKDIQKNITNKSIKDIPHEEDPVLLIIFFACRKKEDVA